jgi:carboxypeptidase family protein
MQARRLARHWIRSHLIAMAIQAASAVPTAAQTTAILQGAVFDPSGAVVPAASVRVQHRANGTERAVVTDGRGHFEIVALATGDYRIEVQAPGFQAQIVEAKIGSSALRSIGGHRAKPAAKGQRGRAAVGH